MANNKARYIAALKKGRTYNANKRYKEAIGAYRIAISEFANQPDAYAGLGEACIGLRHLDRALECFKLAARYSRGDVKYLNKVADIQERLGQLSDAGRTYMAAGEVCLRQRDIDGAIGNWERAVRLEPNLLGAHQRLATAFQRTGNVRMAVREYLAIARILDMRGERKKALRMCKAALRLDPENQDVMTAVRLIQHGEMAYPDPEPEVNVPEPEVAPATRTDDEDLFAAVQQMAQVLESEKSSWNLQQHRADSSDPVEGGKQLAQEQLSGEMLRDEEDDDEGNGGGLTKLERDALIGQAMDFESRGETQRAIECYQKAINGGLHLAGAHFMLGYLALELGANATAEASLRNAARLDGRFQTAVDALMVKM